MANKLKVWGEEFILSNNNGKFDRAAQEVGDKATPEAFLAAYDRLCGLILDKEGRKIENGIFAKRYAQWKEEQPKYIETLEERERTLDMGEKRTIELISKHVDHKRAFLGTLMTIAAGVVAGLFILAVGKDSNVCSNILATISGFGFAGFIVASSAYLTLILARESVSLDKHQRFIQDSKRDFITKVNVSIVDLDTYEDYRKQKYEDEKNLKLNEWKWVLSEWWFVGISALFILSTILLLLVFLSPVSKICIVLGVA